MLHASDVLRIVMAQIRHHRSRSAALLLGIVVAITSFTVLTGSATTTALAITGVVSQNFTTTYDVLVRPKGATTAVERSAGIVAPNFLAGIQGGITIDQYRRISDMPGVEVAAPIAMIGYVLPAVPFPLDFTAGLDASPRQLFRVSSTRTTDSGLTRHVSAPTYIYATRAPLEPDAQGDTIKEMRPDGTATVCPTKGGKAAGPFALGTSPALECWSTQTGYRGLGDVAQVGLPAGHVGSLQIQPLPLLIAAIDPVPEAKLAGVDAAIISGRYLRPDDGPGATTTSGVQVPVLASARNYLDDSTTWQIDRLPDAMADQVARAGEASPILADTAGTPVLRRTATADEIYKSLLSQMTKPGQTSFFTGLDGLWSAAPVTYAPAPSPALVPQIVANPSSVWTSRFQASGFVRVPVDNDDKQFRTIQPHPSKAIRTRPQVPTPVAVGVFDPTKLASGNDLTRVPLGAYLPSTAAGADATALAALQGQQLLPNSNLGGYLSQPPQLLTTLSGMSAFLQGAFEGVAPQAPISVIRVRVAGVTGPDPTSRERVNQVVLQIQREGGLDVDVTVGSSPSPQTVALPAGDHGRPDLLLSEDWVKKGVAIAILSAQDRKSLVLFALILIVCALFVTNAATAAVRARGPELGVLACLGWSRGRLFRVVLWELGIIGLSAGIIGVGLAYPIAQITGLPLSWARVAFVIPVAVVLALLAGIGPARRAARSDPGTAVMPTVATPRRANRPRRITTMAAKNLLRAPGRTLLASLSLGIGICALTMIVGLALAFRGAVVGSLLGDAVAVQVRAGDYVAVVMIVVLGAFSVADMLYLNIQERAFEFAVLRATGWGENHITRLVATEGAFIGVLGACGGAASGLVAVALFGRAFSLPLVEVAVGAALVGVILATASAVVPVALLRRMPTAQLLAQE